MSAPPVKPQRKDLPTNQRGVALAWTHGYSMQSGHMRTDGETVWSWRLVIGVTRGGAKVAIDHRGEISGSTTRHVGEVVALTTRVEAPS